jgi:hypothetical protein
MCGDSKRSARFWRTAGSQSSDLAMRPALKRRMPRYARLRPVIASTTQEHISMPLCVKWFGRFFLPVREVVLFCW